MQDRAADVATPVHPGEQHVRTPTESALARDQRDEPGMGRDGERGNAGQHRERALFDIDLPIVACRGQTRARAAGLVGRRGDGRGPPGLLSTARQGV
jgi:hypothetical protein